jgi:hypothetical protein
MRAAHVQFVHDSTVVSWKDARRVTAALARQVRDHFGPAYGVSARVELVERGRQDPTAWQIALVDDAPSAEDDGWHELTARGQPLGKVLLKKVIAETGGWSSTASHELLELLADPGMSLSVLVYGARGSHFFAYEVCDPVQDDRFSYFVDRVRVSDFVYPAWFESFREHGSTRFDHVGACTRPLQILPGGYASVAHANWARGWRDDGPTRGRIGRPRGTRRARRIAPRDEWRKSDRRTNR